jgi:predicted acylesterase/phospholipase RssA
MNSLMDNEFINVFNKYVHVKPENYQPSGYADFSKINTPKNMTVTYTNLDTKTQEVHTITRTELTDENGIDKFIYTLPLPFV